MVPQRCTAAGQGRGFYNGERDYVIRPRRGAIDDDDVDVRLAVCCLQHDTGVRVLPNCSCARRNAVIVGGIGVVVRKMHVRRETTRSAR